MPFRDIPDIRLMTGWYYFPLIPNIQVMIVGGSLCITCKSTVPTRAQKQHSSYQYQLKKS
jgi:hypothetical protein